MARQQLNWYNVEQTGRASRKHNLIIIIVGKRNWKLTVRQIVFYTFSRYVIRALSKDKSLTLLLDVTRVKTVILYPHTNLNSFHVIFFDNDLYSKILKKTKIEFKSVVV